MISNHRLHPARQVGLASWLQISLSGTAKFNFFRRFNNTYVCGEGGVGKELKEDYVT
jgi:hypothetical protein